MYVLDPDRGRRRRAIGRDKLMAGAGDLFDELDKASRDVVNRSRGIVSGARRLVSRRTPEEQVLAARVRSKIGRMVSHPHAIHATVEDGRVILDGPVLRNEVDRLLSGVRSVPGVREVISRVEAHEDAAGVSSLQGGHPRESLSEFAQENWTPALRVLVGAAGGALAVYGLRANGPMRVAGALAGGALLARATANRDFRRLVGAGGPDVIEVQKTVHIQAPVEEVFGFWTDYRNFPRFMTHLKEVRDLGNGRSHWVAEGPGGVPVTWDAEVTELVPNQRIVWRSLPGSRIENEGVVRFDPGSDGGTRVSVRMFYNPPAGVLGHAIASILGVDPKHDMDEDLIRMKSLIEIGKTRVRGARVTREQIQRHAM